MTKEKIGKKAFAIGAGALLIGGFAGAMAFPVTQTETITVTETVEVPATVDVDAIKAEAYQAGVDSVDITKDNEAAENLGYNLGYDEGVEAGYTDGREDYLKLEQALRDREILDDASSALAQIEAEDEAIALAIAEIKEELADKLDDEGIVGDDDDVEDIDIESDYDDIDIKKSDYDEEEYKFVFDVEFKDDETDKDIDVKVTVEVEEGKAKIVKVELD